MRRLFGSVLLVGLALGPASRAQAQVSVSFGGPGGIMVGRPYGYPGGYGAYNPYVAGYSGGYGAYSPYATALPYGYSGGYGAYSPYATAQPYGYSSYNSYGSAYVAPGTTSFNSGTYGYMGSGAGFGQGYYGAYPPMYNTPMYSSPVYGYSSSYGYRAVGGPFMGVPRPFAGLLPVPR